MNKIKELINLKLIPSKVKNGLSRKTLLPEIVDIQNTIFKDDSLISINNDTNVIVRLSRPSKYLKIVSNITSENKKAQTQIFYKSKDEGICEKNSITYNTNQIKTEYIFNTNSITHIRLDAINKNGKFDINYFEVIKITKLEFEIAKKKETLKKIKILYKNNPSLKNKLLKEIKENGIKSALKKMYKYKVRNENQTTEYQYTEPSLSEKIKLELENFKIQPLISIIMPVYNVDPKWLNLAIESIESQWYENWELCIADDKSTNKDTIKYLKSLKNSKIKIKYLDKNVNISGSSNAALEISNGEYIALMDNDDEITPDALYEVVKAINERDAEFIYSDEDFLTINEKHVSPHYKPDFSPDLLLSHNYITHFSCFKTKLLEEVGIFNPEYDGAQDYDLFLRLTEKANKVYHIQKVLYHWRMLETSTSSNSEAKPEALNRGKNLLIDTLKRRKIKAEVLNSNLNHYFRVKYEILDEPLVSIIIPFKDLAKLTKMCINSILDKSTYQNFEIIGISNNSEENETFNLIKELKGADKRVKFYEYNVPFNYSSINNHAVQQYASGEHIILLNNDIEIISSDWIESMLEHSQRKEVGCVGAKLYYPNETVQHAGVIIGLGGYAAHSHKYYNRDDYGYFNRLNVVQNLSAVTAACMMVKKSIYNEVGGLNEVDFKIAYNDVDFCLRVIEKGYLNIFTPYSESYHHESISRGYEETSEKLARFQAEKDALSLRHKDILENGDPYYNPNLTLDREDFSLK